MLFIYCRVDLESKTAKYSGHSDLALLKLDIDLEFGELIQPICLPFVTGEIFIKAEHSFN